MRLAQKRDDIECEVAIKIVDLDYIHTMPDEKKRIEREITILKKLEHPYLMKLHDVIETKTHKYMILEYLRGGELYDYLLKQVVPLTFAASFRVSLLVRDSTTHPLLDFLRQFSIAQGVCNQFFGALALGLCQRDHGYIPLANASSTHHICAIGLTLLTFCTSSLEAFVKLWRGVCGMHHQHNNEHQEDLSDDIDPTVCNAIIQMQIAVL